MIIKGHEVRNVDLKAQLSLKSALKKLEIRRLGLIISINYVSN
jgi:hypothetical protein